jgi:ADP-heptose:LPS heptosyltransferase
MGFRRSLKKRIIEAAVSRLRRRKLSPQEVLALDPARVLIVRQHNQMGDMVCATPALRALRRAYPRARVALVCAPLNFEVVQHNPDLDHVLVFDKKGWTRPARLWRFWQEIRLFRPDLVFVLNSVSFSVTSALMALASGAPVIVGGDSRPFGWDISRHVYALEMPSRPELDRHAVEHSLAPMQAIGITTDDLTTVVRPTASEREAAARWLAALHLEEPFWVIHPGAGKRENLWPAERFAAVAGQMAAAARVLVLQGPADGPVITVFRRALEAAVRPEVAGRIDELPVQPVGVCAALLERAARFLCNDTGLMHVAGAVGAPTLALFGPTDWRLWKPQADSVVALQAEGGGLFRLSVERVWEAFNRLPARQTVTS